MGMDPEALDVLIRAAEMHDIGKMAIPDTILNKPGPLDAEEWAFMRRHTILGERILSAAPALIPVAKLVRSSHERWDGEGYPDGIGGSEIPLGSRIIFACDAFDAITTTRVYSVARSPGGGTRRAVPLRRHAVRPTGRRGAVQRRSRPAGQASQTRSSAQTSIAIAPQL